MTHAVLALGSNLGDRAAHLRSVLGALGPRLVGASTIYETPPWGDTDQPAYLNQVVLAADDALGPRDWLRLAHDLEQAAGRVRDPERRFGPRTLDVDVIAVDDVVLAEPDLELPHPRAHLRAFVLVPWAEIDPGARLPGHGPIRDLLRQDPVRTDAESVVAWPRDGEDGRIKRHD